MSLFSAAVAAVVTGAAATASGSIIASFADSGDTNQVVTGVDTTFITEGEAAQVTSVTSTLDAALKSLRNNAQTLGSNVALLQTRLDFTDVYVDVLETGASKLTLADLNEEGANLLALQTRQQLGISALAFAGQAEQGILALFR